MIILSVLVLTKSHKNVERRYYLEASVKQTAVAFRVPTDSSQWHKKDAISLLMLARAQFGDLPRC